MKKAVATLSALVTLVLGTSAALANPIEPPDWLQNSIHIHVTE